MAEAHARRQIEPAAELLASSDAPIRVGSRPTEEARFYAGVGSRDTPEAVQRAMTVYAQRLAAAGYVLRSGAAAGADYAFEAGAGDRKEIFLPYDGFRRTGDGKRRFANGRDTFVLEGEIRERAVTMASFIHPNWGAVVHSRLANFTVAAHARDCTQVLGRNLDDPVEFLVCWAPVDGDSIAGGTRTAYELARHLGIPTFKLAREHDRAAFDAHLASLERAQQQDGRSAPAAREAKRVSAPEPEAPNGRIGPILVANVRASATDRENGIYVGRRNVSSGFPVASPLANPFVVGARGPDGNPIARGEAVTLFAEYLERRIDAGDVAIAKELDRIAELALKDRVTLLCWCAPEACHAAFIREKVIERAQILARDRGVERPGQTATEKVTPLSASVRRVDEQMRGIVGNDGARLALCDGVDVTGTVRAIDGAVAGLDLGDGDYVIVWTAHSEPVAIGERVRLTRQNGRSVLERARGPVRSR